MIAAGQIDGDVTQHRLVMRGITGAVIFLLLAAGLTAFGKGEFSDQFEVSALVDDSGGSLTPGSDVKARGVIIGRVDAIERADRGVRIVMTLKENKVAGAPSAVTARVLPAAVFGTAFVDMIPTDGGSPLREGSEIRQAVDGKTMELQDALDNTDRVLAAIDPAELATTLHSIGTALDGRGEEIGQTIELTDSFLAKVEPEMPLVRDVLGRSATVLRLLDDVAPDVMAGFEDSRDIMETIRDEEDAISDTLTSSDQLVRTGDEFLRAQRVLFERVIRRVALVFDALYDFRSGFPTGFTAFGDFAATSSEGLTSGPWLVTDGAVKIDGSEHYTPADCPRYGPVHGDNCGDN